MSLAARALRFLDWHGSVDRLENLVVSAGFTLTVASGCAIGAPAKPVEAFLAVSMADNGAAARDNPPGSPLLAHVDLESILGNDAHELSGSYYDSNTRRLYAVSDRSPRIACLRVSTDYRAFAPCDKIRLNGSIASKWDGEALAWRGGEFYLVANETNAEVERFDGAGHFLGQVSIAPALYERVLENKGLESLTISPTGSYLFAANEFALPGDPTAPSIGATIRILRRSLDSGTDAACAYRTEPYRGDLASLRWRPSVTRNCWC